MTRRKQRGEYSEIEIRAARRFRRLRAANDGDASALEQGYDPYNNTPQETPESDAEALDKIDAEIDDAIARAEEIHGKARQRKRGSEAPDGTTPKNA